MKIKFYIVFHWFVVNTITLLYLIQKHKVLQLNLYLNFIQTFLIFKNFNQDICNSLALIDLH